MAGVGRRLCGLAAMALAPASVLAATALAPASALAATVSFTKQGCTTWRVPARVAAVRVSATGAAGGAGLFSTGAGGLGDRVAGTISGLDRGGSLRVCVDVGGGTTPFGSDQSYGGIGGGASGVGLGSDFASPLVVAGGGGGSGGTGVNGGSAGMPAGGAGQNDGFDPTGSDVSGGGGGDNTTMTGGAGGVGFGSSGFDGARFTAAGPGQGGSGGGDLTGGGGGGGGYFGGGGGSTGLVGEAAGGGGGSDFCDASVSGCAVDSGAGTLHAAGRAAGDASVALSYTTAPHATAMALSCNVSGSTLICTAVVRDLDPTHPTSPAGFVTFSSNPGAAWIPGACRRRTASDATCIGYGVARPGRTYAVSAAYSGDVSHARASQTTTVGP